MSDLYKFGYTLDETIKTMRDVIDTGKYAGEAISKPKHGQAAVACIWLSAIIRIAQCQEMDFQRGDILKR